MTMDIAEWRLKIDELDRQLVGLINQRAHCAEEIGKLKRNSSIPIYEPDREQIIFDNIARQNKGPLTQVQLRQVYERLVDIMRQIQVDESGQAPVAERTGELTELEPND
jgi:chorismate mutase